MLDRHRARFEADPGDARAFAALEEHHFLRGEWRDLVALYARRLGAPDLDGNAAERARILLRQGQVLEERCADLTAALPCYRQASALQPALRPALRQLRRALESLGEWGEAADAAEREAGLGLPPAETSTLLVAAGRIAADRLGDGSRAADLFARALEAEPGRREARLGLAAAAAASGRPGDAADAYEELARASAGPERIAALHAVARLCDGPLAAPDRALDAWRAVLAEAPDDDDALEGLARAARAVGAVGDLASVAERRFERAHGALRRAEVAVETARLHAESLGDLDAAGRWLARAEALAPDDLPVQIALADLERRRGDRASLRGRLARLLALAPDAVPVETWVEAASLAAEHGDADGSIAFLRGALERAPHDARLLDFVAERFAAEGRDAELADALERRAALATDEPERRAGLLARLGELYAVRLDDLAAARNAWERAFAAWPETPGCLEALQQIHGKEGAWPALRALLESALPGLAGAARVAALSTLGEIALRHSDAPDAAEQARARFEEALALDATAVRALRGLEDIALSTRDPEALALAFERDAAASPAPERRAELARELARRHESEGRLDEAALWAGRLAELEPSAEAWQRCVRLQELRGDDASLCRALEALDAHAAASDRLVLRRRIGALRAELGEEAEACRAFTAALALDPADVPSLEALADLHGRAGRTGDQGLALDRLALHTTGARRAAALDALARLREEALGDVPGAIDALARLAADPAAPADTDARLEALLERTGRLEALADHLAARLAQRRGSVEPSDGSPPPAAQLVLRRAETLERLGRFEEAAASYAIARCDLPGDARVLLGQERVARATGDGTALAAALAARSASLPAEEAAPLQIERAALLADVLDRTAEAARVLAEVADDEATPADLAAAADDRLQRLLERDGAWSVLRARLERRIARASDDRQAAFAAHERLARLCRDRLHDEQAAIRHLVAAAELRPERADLWQNLALLHADASRPAELVRALEGELGTGPEPARERQLRARAAQLWAGPLANEERAEAHWRRVSELAPGDPEACEFLALRFERAGRHGELARLLEARLAVLDDADPAARSADQARRASVRLRLARLRSESLGDPAGAVDVLEPLLDELGPIPAVAEPLAALYTTLGQGPSLEDLCASAAALAEGPTRAAWLQRLGEARDARGDAAGAAEAFRGALDAQPGRADTQVALCAALRRLGESAALARLLDARLARADGPEEIALRLELAGLLAGPLDRGAEALPHLRRVLELEPGNEDALCRAIDAARATGRAAEVLPLLDAAVAAAERECVPAAARADIVARKAALLGDDLSRHADAAACWREAIALDPGREAAWHARTDALEAAGDVPGLLETLLARSERSGGADRLALLGRAAEIAERHLAPEEALPWIERLRRERPADAGTAARACTLLRRCAGEPARALELARALEAELALTRDPARRRALQQERAELIERELDAPARAAEAWEEILRSAPGDADALRQLERIYTALDRHADRARILDAWIPVAAPAERLALRRRLAALLHGPLADPGRAAHELELALEEGDPSAEPGVRSELLQTLGALLLAAGRRAAWARIAEAELARLEPGAEVFAERRRVLRAELARIYGGELADAERAIGHLRAIVDDPAPPAGEVGEVALARLAAERDAAESRLLDLLRQERAEVELAARLAARLSRRPEDPDAWRELADLRAERLHDLPGAIEAYRGALDRRPGDLGALRGLRAACERMGDASAVAGALEAELALHDASDPGTRNVRAALWRRLGEIAWSQLGSTTRASRAFACALEADPGDEVALRALERLLEEMDDWRGALALYESEVELLAGRAPERRRTVWLRVAEIARARTGDPARAIAAFEAAAVLGPLAREERAALAALYAAGGDLESHVRVAATVCDDPERPGDALEELSLAQALEKLGRPEEAITRTLRSLAQDPARLEAWDTLARLREGTADAAGAAEALAEGAPLASGSEAAMRLERAAALVVAQDPVRACGWLERATAWDPASASAHAALARVAAGLGRDAAAASAAERALGAAGGDALGRDERLAIALLGARAAHATQDLLATARLLDAALALDPVHEQALGTRGEIAVQLGDAERARDALEGWLAAASPDVPPGVRARRLVLLGRSVARIGDAATARARFEEAIACHPADTDAWSELVALLDGQGAAGDAAAALELWAESTGDAATRARCLLQAAERLEPLPDGAARSLALLRSAVAADGTAAPAWARLAARLWQDGFGREALAAATSGLPHAHDVASRAALSLVRARGLEAEDDRRAAAEAYAETARLDPACVEAALAAARLLRALGEWRAAGDVLASFAASFAADDREAVAPVLLQLGRLRAGPLEDVTGAVEAYERAVAARPSLREAREALAELLSHQPARWDEALQRHRELLENQPTRIASLRAVLRVARGRGADDAARSGLAILRAIGAASPEERELAPARVALRVGDECALEHVVWERARLAVREVEGELAEALGAPAAGAPAGPAAAATHRFREAALRAEAELAGRALVPLDPQALGDVVRLVVQLAHDHERVAGDGPLVNALAGALGRWARRRVRKALGDTGPEEVAEIDFMGWRAELRTLACARALDACDGELREALGSLLAEAGVPTPAGDESDLTALVESAPEARELLRRVVLAWVDTVQGRA